MSLPVAILSGGLATRLRPLTEKIPKALIEINGKPFIDHQLRLLAAGGIKKVVVCAWYRGDMIRDAIGDGKKFNLKVEYSFDGDRLLGTGGAVRKALPLLGENFFVLYGDSYLPCDYEAVAAAFRSSGKDALMTVHHNRDQGDRSNVRFSGGRILAYHKEQRTPVMEHIDYGLGVFRAAPWEVYEAGRAFDLAEVYQKLLGVGQLAGYEVPQRFFEIGSLSGIEDLKKHLQKVPGTKGTL